MKTVFIVLSLVWVVIASVITAVLAIPLTLLFIWFGNKILFNVLLMVVARVLSMGLFPIGFSYSVIKTIVDPTKTTADLSAYIRRVAISNNQKGNTICGVLFNDALITKDGYQFGNEDEVLSSVLGKNVVKGTLQKLGELFNRILSVFEENHTVVSIEEDEGLETIKNQEL